MVPGQGFVRQTLLAAGVILLAACGGGGGGGDFVPAGPKLNIADTSKAEGNAGQSALTFTVSLSGTPEDTVEVDFATMAGSATAGADFVGTSGTLTFPVGTASMPVTVNIIGDLLNEADETFQVVLSNVAGDASIVDGTATGTITNDDPLPALSIADAGITEGNSGTSALNFTVTLAPASGRTVSVNYATANMTATAPSDFTAASGTLDFSAGQTSRQVTVMVNGDTGAEGDEVFAVNLSNPVNATIADGQATGTITNDDEAAQFGLDARPVNSSCVAPARATGGLGWTTVDAFPAAPDFTEPTKILQAPGDASRWFILEKAGRIKVLNTANPAAATTYLNFEPEVDPLFEGGLLGMAFHPEFPAVKEIYLSYTASGSPLVSVISRVILDNTTTPSKANSTEQVLLTINHPFGNHQGGDIAFGADGNLYISMGDGGSNGDSQNHAQDTTDLLGTMMRINVLGVAWPTPGYTIPGDNPFALNPKCGPGSNAQSCPEIYAWGFRNPWRWSFDRQTGNLWLADVGQSSWEEVNLVQKGGNYGWRCREGAHDFNTAGCPGGLVDPVAEYTHNDGQTNISITGGYVYRGNALPQLQGKYIFGDFNTGRLWSLEANGGGGWTRTEIFLVGHNISAFALGEDGELYFADYEARSIGKLVPNSGGTPDLVPDDLADTGCVNPASPTQPASGLVPYGLNAPFWSDGAEKERWLAIPDGTTITVNGATGDWDLPNGSVITKLFRINGNPVETRLLMRHPDGEWRGYTWEWNDSGTAATRVKDGKTRTIAGQQWIYPSEVQCLHCHTAAAGRSLGPETAQLNGNHFYPGTGRTANQLATLNHIGMFSAPLADPATLPALPDPTDTSQPLASRARAWLHTNCAQCHRPGGPTPANMDLRYTTALSATGTCNVAPSLGDLGIGGAMLIKPGNAGESIIPERMNRRDVFGMPPLATLEVDSAGVSLVRSWINSLANCL